MRISIIVAAAENGVIGRNGELPWHLSGDLRRFKQLTMDHTIIMGRRTWESIGRALPGRHTVVVSRNPELQIDVANVDRASGLDEALELARGRGDKEAFIVGGAELYRESLDKADRIYLTRVCATVDGDTSFPEVAWSDWRLIATEEYGANEKNDHAYRFETYDRR